MANQNIVSFRIKSDEKVINNTLQVVEIEVHNNVSGVSQARIVLLTNGDVSELADAPDFEANRSIEILLGYDSKDQSVFKGEVTGQSLHIKSGEGVAYEVVCESFDQEQVLPPEDISKANSALTLSSGNNVLSCSIHADPNVSTQIMGTIGTQGNSAVVPGSVVTLDSFGNTFNGKQYVSGVNHHVGNGNWVTDVNIGMVEEENEFSEFDETSLN